MSFSYVKGVQCMLNTRAVTGSSGGSNASTNQVWAKAGLGSEVHKPREDHSGYLMFTQTATFQGTPEVECREA